MKKLVIAIPLAIALSAFAQSPSPTPNPTPFDALGIAPRPIVSGSQTVAQQQAALHQQIKNQSKMLSGQIRSGYLAILAACSTDDSAKGGLSLAQKLAAFTPAEQIELCTVAWAMANLLNGLATNGQGSTVSNPTWIITSGTTVITGS